MNFQAPESLSEQIAQHLGRKIIKGDLRPKERIQELKIAKELDVSRGSVREALLILERRHLIEIFPRKGAVVSELSPHLVSSLFDMHIYLLTLLSNKLAEKWQDDDLKPMLGEIRKLNRLVNLNKDSTEEIIDNGLALVSFCFPIVNNPYLEETLDNFKPALTRVYYLALSRRPEEIVQIVKFYNDLVVSVQERSSMKINRIIKVFGDHHRAVVLDVLREMAEAAAFVS